MTELGFTRADLVNAQDIYGTPAAYQLGQSTQKSAQPSEDDPIPTHESVEQELQIDIFYLLLPGTSILHQHLRPARSHHRNAPRTRN